MNFKNKRILIVEDERDYFEISSSIIKKEFGCGIDRAENGRDGLALALAGSYDLLLLDIGLPFLNGIELLKKLKSSGKFKTPVIMFTVRSELDLVSEALSLGIEGYLIKPFEIDEFVLKIKNALKK